MRSLKAKRSARKIKLISRNKRFNLYATRFDASATENGIFPSDQEWKYEAPNQEKNEEIFIYGTDSNENLIAIKFKRKPMKDGKCLVYASLLYKESDDFYEFEAVDLVNEEDSVEYRLHGLHIQILSPFRKLRITFRGILRKRTINANEMVDVYTRIRLFWYPLSKVFDMKLDNKAAFIAKDVTLNDLNDETLFEDRYEQYGQIKGTIQIECETLRNIYLWGNKCKKFCDNDSTANKTWKRMFAYSREGLAFHFGASIDHKNNRSYRYGHCSTSLVQPLPVVKTSLSLKGALNLNKVKQFQMTTTSKRTLNIVLCDEWKQINDWCSIKKCKINGIDGGCILVEENSNEDYEQMLNNLKFKPTLNTQRIAFDGLVTEIHGECFGSVCGGKGSSLSQLSYISNQINKMSEVPDFEVPNGVIVTTNAYSLFMTQNSNIFEIVNNLQTKVWTKSYENLKNECDETTTFIKEAKLSPEIESEIKRSLINIFGEDAVEQKLFAVRSSAVGEDSEDMSAAGQMSSFLGVKGYENIFASILKCWSSQFTHIAVEYKHGFGQLINTPMAVVIQEMVDCDVAGVMFTCNPIDGDPRKVVITANYGLCETVVSAKSEPDTVIVSVNTITEEVLKLESIDIGSKKYLIRLADSGGEGTVESETSEEESQTCCLDSAMALELAKLALFLRRCLENERDIEWGIKENKIYLLQSRPVTNLETYSEWEIFHELDFGLGTERAVLTRANVGEVLPGSLSPLGLTLFHSILMVPWSVSIKKFSKQMSDELTSPYRMIAFVSICNQLLFDLKGFSLFDIGNEVLRKAGNISFLGYDLKDEDIDSFLRRGVQIEMPSVMKLMMTFAGKYIALLMGPMVRKGLKKVKGYKLFKSDHSFETSKQLFDYMFNSMTEMFEVSTLHSHCTNISNTANVAIIMTLYKNNVDSETDLLNDVSLLLSTNKDVVSVEIPRMLREIASKIENPKYFKNLTEEEALDYIKNSGTEASEMFATFLKEHGHRGYKEFDIYVPQWEQNPIPIIKILQNIVDENIPNLEKVQLSPSEMVTKIKTNLTSTEKYMLKKFWLPLSQNGVGFREQSKSELVAQFNEYRKGFIQLSEMMVNEGRLPSKELMFYLTLEEVRRVLTERDASVISRAKLRMKHFPTMNAMQFDEIVKGPNFKPRNESDESHQHIPNGEKVSGIPVCIGKITGRAIVARSFDDVHLIQPNDILITFATDVGWSPYFPLLSGIATEIGGLISHGAVIAREYGLPCLVGVKNATQIFKTGDQITLDAASGVIYRV